MIQDTAVESNYPRSGHEQVRRKLYRPVLFYAELCLTTWLATFPLRLAYDYWAKTGANPLRLEVPSQGVYAYTPYVSQIYSYLLWLLFFLIVSAVLIKKRPSKDLRANFLIWPWVMMAFFKVIAFFGSMCVGAVLTD